MPKTRYFMAISIGLIIALVILVGIQTVIMMYEFWIGV